MSKRVAISANEFCVTVAKACVARGVERSAAREMALGCCVLEQDGVGSLTVLLDALSHFDADGRAAGWVVEGGEATVDTICVLRDGSAAFDLAAAFLEVSFACDVPLLMVGLARYRGAKLDVWLGGEWVPARKVLLGDVGQASRFRVCGRVTPAVPSGPIVFRDPSWWRRIEETTRGLLVPATDATRADAGAGNTDND